MFKGRELAPCEVRGRVHAEIALNLKHAEHCVCARGDAEKGSFWRHRRQCLIWMQLIRKVDWFDGTSGAGQQSALVCEGVHAQVDIYAFQGSFNNNIKGSMKKPCFLFLCLSSRTQSTHNYTHPCLINFSLLSPQLCVQISGKTLWWIYFTVFTCIKECWFFYLRDRDKPF